MQQLALNGTSLLAKLDEAHRQLASPMVQLLRLRRRRRNRYPLPFVVGLAEVRWKANQLPTVDRWKLAAHLERAIRGGSGEVELGQPCERPKERRMAPTLVAQPERSCRFG